MNTIYEAAKAYAALGWHLFPLHTIVDGKCSCGILNCSDAGKHPRLARGLKEASNDPERIEIWFGKDAPPSNIGLVTGEVSGITVIDIDIGDGKLGAESWAEAIEGHGEPQTLIAETGSGGMHVIFQYNSVLKTASNVLGRGIDSRNDGGYIVAAPSKHRSGGHYRWLNWGERLATLPAHLSRRKETRGRPKKNDMYNGRYSIEQVRGMLEVIPADDRDLWRSVGIILGRVFKRIDEAWKVYEEWANKLGGKKGRNHDEIMREAFYELSQQNSEKELTLGTIVKAAIDNGWAPKAGEVPLGNFVFYGPGNNFIYRPTISYWIAAAVDAAVSPVNNEGKIIKASEHLKLHSLVTSLTSDPSIDEDYKKGFDSRNGEIVEVAGAALFNTYRKSTIELGDAKLARPFTDHCKKVFNKPGDAEQFLDYMAHRVQKPWEKPRFALLIAGEQGIGKDTAVEFCCPAIGAWNVAAIDPSALEANFNEYEMSTLVRISEAANLQEMTKWAFNEKTKVLIAGNPDTVTINPKYGQKLSVRRYCGVIITTNHLTSGIYIPDGDRRYDVIESAKLHEMGFKDKEERGQYFEELWEWFLKGGDSHVAAYLNERDISKFSANSGQRLTDAWHSVVAHGSAGDNWLYDAMDKLGNPSIVRADWVFTAAVADGMKDVDVRRLISNAMTRHGYHYHRSNSKDGRWKIDGKNVSVWVKNDHQGEVNVDKLGGEKF
jgi:hypothetical protein